MIDDRAAGHASRAASQPADATRRTPAILRCDADLRVVDMNPPAGQVLSRRREEVVGHSLFRHLDDHDSVEVERIRGRLITRGVKVDTIDVRCTGRSGDAAGRHPHVHLAAPDARRRRRDADAAATGAIPASSS